MMPKPSTTETILVTGGAGFLGSHLCEKLLKHGYAVICMDNFLTGSRNNILHLQQYAGFSLLEQDVCRPIEVEVAAICNLACPASPIHYQLDPVRTTRTCVEGAIRVLDLARKLRIPVLQASTSEIYGDPEVHPQPEDYRGNVSTIGPRSCYDEGKRCAETLFFDYYRQYGVQIKVARIFNAYGPRMLADDGRVVSNFIVQALRREQITLYGDGRQTRSFCYVDDLVDGLILMLQSPAEVTGPINLGNPHEISMVELADKILQLTDSNSRFCFKPLPEDDPLQRQPDIARAINLLGWHPLVALDAGLQKTINYFSRNPRVLNDG